MAYSSKLSLVRTGDKVLFMGLPLLFCLFASSWLVPLLVLAAMGFATVQIGGIHLKRYVKLLLIPLGFIFLGVLTIGINQIPQGTQGVLVSVPLFGSRFGVTWASLQSCVTLLLRAFASVSCLYFLCLNTPMNQLLDFLRKIKLPKLLIELMELIYRFIFVIWEEASRIYLAQNTRLGYRDFRTGLSSMGELVSRVFISAMGRAERMNVALEARCFDGGFQSITQEETPCMLLRCSALVFTILLLGIIIFI